MVTRDYSDLRQTPSWTELLVLARGRIQADVAELVKVLGAWSERAYQRRVLSTLDERMLKDLGLTRADVEREATKPFWRP
jgi:uncharacterized protein YjiS (DUF1127 family)